MNHINIIEASPLDAEKNVIMEDMALSNTEKNPKRMAMVEGKGTHIFIHLRITYE